MLPVPTYKVDYCKQLTYGQRKALFRPGARVVRGRNWSARFADSFSPGVVVQELGGTLTGWIGVKWQTGPAKLFRMGRQGKCDLELIREFDACKELATRPALQGACSTNAICSAPTSDDSLYTCTCKEGFRGDGYNCLPTNGTIPAGYGSCSFDNEWCEWQSHPLVPSHWLRNVGRTATLFTGPNHGSSYTNTSGGYVYFEASGKSTGTRGTLRSPVLPGGNSNFCQVRFFYHMYGSHIGSLLIYVVSTENATQRQLIWRQEGDRGDTWFPAFVNINSSVDFRLEFVAVRGPHFYSDKAIDDVTFGKCLPESKGEHIVYGSKKRMSESSRTLLICCKFDFSYRCLRSLCLFPKFSHVRSFSLPTPNLARFLPLCQNSQDFHSPFFSTVTSLVISHTERHVI